MNCSIYCASIIFIILLAAPGIFNHWNNAIVVKIDVEKRNRFFLFYKFVALFDIDYKIYVCILF